MEISDIHNRTFKTLRVSLINLCNLGCTYCVNETEEKSIKSASDIESKTPLEYIKLIKIIEKLHSILGLETIRLTGGEPTLYKDLAPLVSELTKLNIPIKLTTNGLLLKTILEKIPSTAFDSINISLDALDEEIFYRISRRRNLKKILEAVELALSMKIHVKLNCVVIKGVNENQILPLIDFAGKRGISVRFLEIMKMGHLQNKVFQDSFVSEIDILKTVQTQYSVYKLSRNQSATANYWLTDTGFKFGIIANETEPFCQDCNRLRLDSFGNLFGCLSNNNSFSIIDQLDNDLKIKETLKKALAQKQPLRFKGSELSMLEIGG